MNRYDCLPIFEKEFKRLSKQYRTLKDDFDKFKKVLEMFPTGVGNNFVIIHSGKTIKIVKARMACQALRDRSLRIIYGYKESNASIDFIEIYFKGDKENEDRGRITNYLQSNQF